MLSKISKVALAATSLAPVLLTVWFVEFSKTWYWKAGIIYIVCAALLALLSITLVYASRTKLEHFDVTIKSVKTADKEIVGFLLVYLLPLINKTEYQVNTAVLVFIAALFLVVVLTTHSYHFNPILGFLGFHFYEITVEGEVTYILITRKDIRNCKSIKKVVLLTEYMIMEV